MHIQYSILIRRFHAFKNEKCICLMQSTHLSDRLIEIELALSITFDPMQAPKRHLAGAGQRRSVPRLPDFSWYNIPKRGKYTKLPQNISNAHKMYQISVK
jgi:hypothetical protein